MLKWDFIHFLDKNYLEIVETCDLIIEVVKKRKRKLIQIYLHLYRFLFSFSVVSLWKAYYGKNIVHLVLLWSIVRWPGQCSPAVPAPVRVPIILLASPVGLVGLAGWGVVVAAVHCLRATDPCGRDPWRRAADRVKGHWGGPSANCFHLSEEAKLEFQYQPLLAIP